MREREAIFARSEFFGSIGNFALGTLPDVLDSQRELEHKRRTGPKSYSQKGLGQCSIWELRAEKVALELFAHGGGAFY